MRPRHTGHIRPASPAPCAALAFPGVGRCPLGAQTQAHRPPPPWPVLWPHFLQAHRGPDPHGPRRHFQHRDRPRQRPGPQSGCWEPPRRRELAPRFLRLVLRRARGGGRWGPLRGPSGRAAPGGRTARGRALSCGRGGLQTLEGGGRPGAFWEDERNVDPGPVGGPLGTAAASSPLSVCPPARKVVWGFQALCQWPRGNRAGAKQGGLPHFGWARRGWGLPSGLEVTPPRNRGPHSGILPALRLRTRALWLTATRGLRAGGPCLCPHP